MIHIGFRADDLLARWPDLMGTAEFEIEGVAGRWGSIAPSAGATLRVTRWRITSGPCWLVGVSRRIERGALCRIVGATQRHKCCILNGSVGIRRS